MQYLWQFDQSWNIVIEKKCSGIKNVEAFNWQITEIKRPNNLSLSIYLQLSAQKNNATHFRVGSNE